LISFLFGKISASLNSDNNKMTEQSIQRPLILSLSKSSLFSLSEKCETNPTTPRKGTKNRVSLNYALGSAGAAFL